MKRIASIVLLIMLLFNWCGYRVFITYLEDNANNRLEAQLDIDRYDPSQLISIKVSTGSLPYANNTRDFKRLSGQVDIEGIQYSFVKWRLLNDTLEFLCIPNLTTTKLKTAKIDFFKLVNDLQQTGQDKKSDPSSNTSKNFLSDYYTINEFSGITDLYFTFLKKSFHYSPNIPVIFPSSIDYPPEYFS